MKVSFSIGPKSMQVINTLSKSADNVEFMSYDSISDMIKESTLRHIFFDRVVISERIISNASEEFTMLNNYIVEYSSGTSVVLICQSVDSGIDKVFASIFNSPLYTPVIVSKVTPSMLLEFVKGDVQELKSRYYVEDNKEAIGVTVKSRSTDDTTVNNVADESAKKGFLRGLFGGKRSKAKNLENQGSFQESPTSLGNGSETVGQNYGESAVSNIDETISNASYSGVNGSGVKSDADGDLFFNDYPLSLGGSDISSTKISENLSEDDDLSIGDFGEQHSDTGFLDEDVEDEINRALEAVESKDVSEGTVFEDFDAPYNIGDANTYFENNIIDNNQIRVVIGERGLGCTSYLVSKAIAKANKGARVLIVDLDFRNNGILSFIDAESFYAEGCESGLSSLKVFSEDGVDVISDGYGVLSLLYDIDVLVDSGLFANYDYVFVDCPLDCIGLLSDKLLEESKVMIRVNGNKGSLSNTISYLTDRRYVSHNIEDILFRVSKFDILNKIEEYQEDLSYMKRVCFFGRNDWLSKLI